MSLREKINTFATKKVLSTFTRIVVSNAKTAWFLILTAIPTNHILAQAQAQTNTNDPMETSTSENREQWKNWEQTNAVPHQEAIVEVLKEYPEAKQIVFVEPAVYDGPNWKEYTNNVVTYYNNNDFRYYQKFNTADKKNLIWCIKKLPIIVDWQSVIVTWKELILKEEYIVEKADSDHGVTNRIKPDSTSSWTGKPDPKPEATPVLYQDNELRIPTDDNPAATINDTLPTSGTINLSQMPNHSYVDLTKPGLTVEGTWHSDEISLSLQPRMILDGINDPEVVSALQQAWITVTLGRYWTNEDGSPHLLITFERTDWPDSSFPITNELFWDDYYSIFLKDWIPVLLWRQRVPGKDYELVTMYNTLTWEEIEE